MAGFDEKVECECGKRISKTNYPRHLIKCNRVFDLCIVCGSNTLPHTHKKYDTQKYCSAKCNRIDNPLLEQCAECGSDFPRKGWRTTCSDKCLSAIISRNVKHTRAESEGNNRQGFWGTHIYYNGIKLDSTWELDVAKWLDSNSIAWQRGDMLRWVDQMGNKRRYHPDFHIPAYNIYLDPKNPYLMKLDREKLDAVRKLHNITLYAGSCDYIFERVQEHMKQITL